MHLPMVEDIRASLPEDDPTSNEDIREALRLAPTVLELMTGSFIHQRTIHQRLLLSNRPERLNHFPAEDVRADGVPIDANDKLGIVYPELEPSNYLMTYVVGYEPTRMPAIIALTVKALARHRLLQDEEDREEVKAAVEAIRRDREKLRRERADG